jgi:hypothetical protein
MSEWSAEDRQRFDEAKRVLQSGDVEGLVALLSGCSPEKLGELGGCSPEFVEAAGVDVSRYCVECERLQDELDALQVRYTDIAFESGERWGECQRLQAELDHVNAIAGNQAHSLRINAALQHRMDRAEAGLDRMRAALQRIAVVNRDKRPDGSYNHDRNALIDIAEDALNGADDE